MAMLDAERAHGFRPLERHAGVSHARSLRVYYNIKDAFTANVFSPVNLIIGKRERTQRTESAKMRVPAPLPTPSPGSGSGGGGGNGSSRKHSPTVTTMYITKMTTFTTTIDTSVLECALTVAAASWLVTGAKGGHIALSDYNLSYFPIPTPTSDPCDASLFSVAGSFSYTIYVERHASKRFFRLTAHVWANASLFMHICIHQPSRTQQWRRWYGFLPRDGLCLCYCNRFGFGL